jgi:hypothetical protein
MPHSKLKYYVTSRKLRRAAEAASFFYARTIRLLRSSSAFLLCILHPSSLTDNLSVFALVVTGLAVLSCRLCFEPANSQVITTRTSSICYLLPTACCQLSDFCSLLSAVCCRLPCFERGNSQVITTRIRHQYVNKNTDTYMLYRKH